MLGFLESPYDERDYEYSIEDKTEELPKEYDYSEYCKLDILDQGSDSTCVPHSIKTMLDTMSYDYKINIKEFYDRRPNKPQEGMAIREALKMIKKDINDPFYQYFRLRSILQIKYSLISNGPCIFALPVRSMDYEFWRGSEDLGGHAICCVGYNEFGFILQNSWGNTFGEYGKCILPYEDLNYLIEAWGII